MYITPKDASEQLGVHYSRVMALIREGRIPAMKISAVYLIKQEDLDEFAKLPRITGRPKKE